MHNRQPPFRRNLGGVPHRRVLRRSKTRVAVVLVTATASVAICMFSFRSSEGRGLREGQPGLSASRRLSSLLGQGGSRGAVTAQVVGNGVPAGSLVHGDGDATAESRDDDGSAVGETAAASALASTGVAASAEPEELEASFEEATQQPIRCQVYAGAGAPVVGELHVLANGQTGGGGLRDWLAEYFWRSTQAWRGGWEPQVRARVGRSGDGIMLRCSKALMPAQVGTEIADKDTTLLCDGSGLELHFETEASRGPLDASGRRLYSQTAEVVVGPRAQARYLNITLPVSLAVGAKASGDSRRSEDKLINVGPLRMYARLHAPPARRLRGFEYKCVVDHPQAGRFFGRFLRPWSGGAATAVNSSSWSLEHQKSLGAVQLPGSTADFFSAVASLVKSPFDYDSGLRPSVVPSTRLRIANGGGVLASLGLESAAARLGEGGWGGSVEVGDEGWSTALHLEAGGGKGSGRGQAGYQVGAHADWGSRPSLVHELRLLDADGQGVRAKLRNGAKGPRVQVGLELR